MSATVRQPSNDPLMEVRALHKPGPKRSLLKFFVINLFFKPECIFLDALNFVYITVRSQWPPYGSNIRTTTTNNINNINANTTDAF